MVRYLGESVRGKGDQLYHIVYEDGDKEDLSKNEFEVVRKLYDDHCTSECSDNGRNRKRPLEVKNDAFPETSNEITGDEELHTNIARSLRRKARSGVCASSTQKNEGKHEDLMVDANAHTIGTVRTRVSSMRKSSSVIPDDIGRHDSVNGRRDNRSMRPFACPGEVCRDISARHIENNDEFSLHVPRAPVVCPALGCTSTHLIVDDLLEHVKKRHPCSQYLNPIRPCRCPECGQYINVYAVNIYFHMKCYHPEKNIQDYHPVKIEIKIDDDCNRDGDNEDGREIDDNAEEKEEEKEEKEEEKEEEEEEEGRNGYNMQGRGGNGRESYGVQARNNSYIKTRQCLDWGKKEGCRYGEQCRFLHGEGKQGKESGGKRDTEIRTIKKVNATRKRRESEDEDSEEDNSEEEREHKILQEMMKQSKERRDRRQQKKKNKEGNV